MNKFVFPILFFLSGFIWSQTKVSGIVVDGSGNPISFANAYFKDSTIGTITNDDGRFYLESDETYNTLIISFIGYTTQELDLKPGANYNLKVILEEGELLDEVVVYTGKQSKKNNPAIDIL